MIIDDHPLFREGMIAALSRVLPDIEIHGCGCAEDGLNFFDNDPEFDMVLIDIRLPGMDGFAALRRFAKQHPTISRMIMTGSDNIDDERRAIAEGASGYLHKSMDTIEVGEAIKTVLLGNVYRHQRVNGLKPKTTPNAEMALTMRQLDVLQLLCEGRSNKEIARILDITERTAKAHVGAIFLALGASNRTKAVMEAQRRGYVPTVRAP
jgi:two-component system, NarL family, nitrate/nitrite response regulator NarL